MYSLLYSICTIYVHLIYCTESVLCTLHCTKAILFMYRIWKDMSLNDSLNELERSKLAVWDYPVSDKYTKVSLYQGRVKRLVTFWMLSNVRKMSSSKHR